MEQTGAVNVALSLEETYEGITPLREPGKISAYLSIMRGCNNMCSFCIVPFTRSRLSIHHLARFDCDLSEVVSEVDQSHPFWMK